MASRRDQENWKDDKFVIFVADVSFALYWLCKRFPIQGFFGTNTVQGASPLF